jgi:hypothetical protein
MHIREELQLLAFGQAPCSHVESPASAWLERDLPIVISAYTQESR